MSIRIHPLCYLPYRSVYVTAQDSTMRSYSTVHERHNKSLGRASYHKNLSKKNSLKFDQHKMPYIVNFVAGR